MSVRLNVRLSKIMCTPIKLGVRTYATYTNRLTLTGFLALQFILRLLPTFTVSPMAHLFNSLAHFIQSIYSACFFNLFFQPVFRPLFESSGLVFSHVFTNFYAYSPPYLFSSHLFIQFFPFLHSLPLPWEFFTMLGIFFQPFFRPFGQSPSNVSPKVVQPLSQFLLYHSPTSKRVAWINESLLLRLRKLTQIQK